MAFISSAGDILVLTLFEIEDSFSLLKFDGASLCLLFYDLLGLDVELCVAKLVCHEKMSSKREFERKFKVKASHNSQRIRKCLNRIHSCFVAMRKVLKADFIWMHFGVPDRAVMEIV